MSNRGYHYYNNGKIQINAHECPEGFVKGMLSSIIEKRKKSLNLKYQEGKIQRKNNFIYCNKKKLDNYNNLKFTITKEKLYSDYIISNLTHEQIQSKYNITSYMLDKLINEYNIHKSKKVSNKIGLETKYKNAGGKENYFKDIENKKRNTIINRYGSLDEYNKLKGNKIKKSYIDNNIVNKQVDTRSHNHTFNSSSPEEIYFQNLKDNFPNSTILRNYKSSVYPFMCDFYIKELDIYIELNLHWTHGFHPFDSNNLEDNNQLGIWKEKANLSKFYQNAIKIWTIIDPLKLETAKKNRLKYYSYYNLNQAIEDISHLQ